MSKYIDGTLTVYFDNPSGNLTIPGTMAIGTLSTGTSQTRIVSTLIVNTSSILANNIQTVVINSSGQTTSSIVANNISTSGLRSGNTFTTNLSTPTINVSSITTNGRLQMSGIRNDETLATGFLHYNPTTLEVVYNSVGGGGGGGGVILSASTLVGTDSVIAPTEFFAQELYTTTAYDVSRFGQSFVRTSISLYYTGVTVSASGQYILACNNGNGSGGYLFLSSNYGVSFQQVGSTQVWARVAMNASGQIQVAQIGGTQNGQMYQSVNYGITWTLLSGSPIAYCAGIAISASGQYISVAEQTTGTLTNGNIWTSSTFGISWSQNPTAPNIVWNSIAMSASGQYQTACAYGGSIWRSVDYGQNWATTGVANNSYYDVSMSASGQYQTTAAIGATGNLYVSSDYGVTWTTRGTLGIAYSGIAVSASGQYQLSFVTGGAAYQSSDYGQTWTTSLTNSKSWRDIAMSAAGNINVIVANDPEYIYINTLSQTIPSLETRNLNVIPNIAGSTPSNFMSTSIVSGPSTNYLSIAVSANGQYMLAGTLEGTGNLYLSSDYGVSFSVVISNLGQWQDAAIADAGNIMYAVNATNGVGGVYISTNYGQTWTLAPGLSTDAWSWINCSASGQYVVAGGPTQNYISSNYGSTWTAVGPSHFSPGGTAVSATGQYMIISPDSVAYISRDYGVTFVTTGINAIGLAISGTGQYILLGYNPASLNISSDYGTTFKIVGSFPEINYYFKCTIDYTGQYQVVCLLGVAIYYSINYGQTWTQVPGLTSAYARVAAISANAQYVAIPGNAGNIYVYSNAVPVPSLLATTVTQTNQLITNSATVTGNLTAPTANVASLVAQNISSVTARVSSIFVSSILNSGSFFVSSLRSDPALTTGTVHYNSTTKELVYNDSGGAQSTISSYQNLFTSSLGINCNSPQYALDVAGTGNFRSTLSPFADFSTANVSTANISTAFISSAQLVNLGVSSLTTSSIVGTNLSTNSAQVNALTTSSIYTSSILGTNLSSLTAQVNALTASSIYVSSILGTNLSTTSAQVNALTTSSILGTNLSTLNAQVNALTASSIYTSSILGTNLSTTSAQVNALTTSSIITSSILGTNLSTTSAQVNALTTSSITTSSILGTNLSTISAQVNALTTSSIITSSILGTNLSTTSAQVNALTTSSIYANSFYGSNASTTTGQVNALTTSSIYANSFYGSNASTTTGQVNALTTSSIITSSILGTNLSTTTGQVNALTTSSIYANSFFGSNASTTTGQVNALTTSSITTSSILGTNLSTTTAQVNALTTSSITTSSILGTNLSTTTAQVNALTTSSITAYSTAPVIATISTANISTANISTLNANNVISLTNQTSSFTANSITPIAFYSWQTTTTTDSFATGLTSVFNQQGSNFTLECFMYPTLNNTFNTVLSLNNAVAAQGNEFRIYYNGANGFGVGYPATATTDGFSTGTATALNTWYHLALVRVGTTITLYLNGTSWATATMFNFTTSANRRLQILNDPYAGSRGQGNINSIRCILGQALYTGAFTPPTQQLTTTSVGTSGANVAASITGTVAFLGAVANSFTDQGPNALPLTISGSPITSLSTPTSFTPSLVVTGTTLSMSTANISTAQVRGLGVSSLTTSSIVSNNISSITNQASTYTANAMIVGPQQSPSAFYNNVTAAGLDLWSPSIFVSTSMKVFVGATAANYIDMTQYVGACNASANLYFRSISSGVYTYPLTLSTSRVGINNANPQYTLDVTGTINASLGVKSNASFLTSDRRIKEFITDANLDICYSNVKNLSLRRYAYISTFKTTKLDGSQIGFIADEVGAIFPKSVKDFPTTVDPNFSSIKHMNYDQIFLAHYGATQKLMTVVENQTEQLQHQSTQMAQLLADNSTLTSMCSYIPQLMNTVSTLKG